MGRVNAIPCRDSQDIAPEYHCDICRGELYHTDTSYAWEGKTICEKCYKELIKDWVEASPKQVADALMVAYEEV